MTKKKAGSAAATRTLYKCTRPDGSDFYTGKLNYALALARGEAVEVADAAPKGSQVCGHGIHVSPTPRQTIQFADREQRPWRWFEGTVLGHDVVDEDAQKIRVRRFLPTRELTLVDLFGPDFAQRIERLKAEAATWRDIPWLKPSRPIAGTEIIDIVGRWREAITPWLRDKTYRLPTAVKVVAGADADADADADAAAAALPWCLRWYISPRHVLWRSARWQLAGMTEASPWAPFVELFRLGCQPIGFARGKFVVYCPNVG